MNTRGFCYLLTGEGQTLGFEISFRSPSIRCEANKLTISSRWNYQSFTFQKLHPWIKSASEQLDCWNKESTNSSHSCHLTRQIISECFFSHVFTVALRKRRDLTTWTWFLVPELQIQKIISMPYMAHKDQIKCLCIGRYSIYLPVSVYAHSRPRIYNMSFKFYFFLCNSFYYQIIKFYFFLCSSFYYQFFIAVKVQRCKLAHDSADKIHKLIQFDTFI